MKSDLLYKVIPILITFFVLAECSYHAEKDQVMEQYAYIAKLKNESFHDSIASGIIKEMAKLKVNVDIFPAHDQKDVQFQIQKITEIISNRNYKGVLISPNDSSVLIPHVKLLDDMGIPFLFIDTQLIKTETSENFNYDCGFVGTDNVLAGELAAKFLSAKITGGNIFMMRGKPYTSIKH